MLRTVFAELLLLQTIHLGATVNYGVKYNHRDLCALNGSTVFINGTYSRLAGLQLKWVLNPGTDGKKTDLRNEPGYSEYFGDEHFSLRLSDVKRPDEFCLRPKSHNGKKTLRCVTLRVTELRVQNPKRVKKGNTTVLTCETTCDLTDTPAFVWYKNGRPVNATGDDCKGNMLTLQPTGPEDEGNYSCAVRGYEPFPSPAQPLTVMYPPKVSVSISPPGGETEEGSSVTLTCSCDANPPVKRYAWFKEKTKVGKERSYTISYSSSENRGSYKCKCTNDVGPQYSDPVTLTIVGRRSKWSLIVLGMIACVGLTAAAAVLLRRNQRRCWSSKRVLKEMKVQTLADDTFQSHLVSSDQEEVDNARIEPRCGFRSREAERSSATSSEKNQHDKQQDELQYATVTFHPAGRPSDEMRASSPVIYSTIQ